MKSLFRVCFAVLFAAQFAWGTTGFTSRTQFDRTLLHFRTQVDFGKAEFKPGGKVSIKGLMNTMDAGLPSVPVKTLKIALPPQTELGHYEWSQGATQEFSVRLVKSAPQRPLSWGERLGKSLPSRAPEITETQYPSSPVKVEIQKLHGVNVALFTFYPITVQRGEKKVNFISHFNLDVDLRPVLTRSHELLAHQVRELSGLVENGKMLSRYGKARTEAVYDYLILSTQKVMGFQGANGLADLQAHLLARGLKSKVLDVAAIDASGTGRDLPEKIRNAIRSEYQANGIRYVLLLGTSTESPKESYLPARRLWSKIKAYFGSGWVDIEEQIASDTYYGCLDGSFNGNNNDKWGEIEDGDKADDVDFLPELSVGRVSVDTDEQLQNFVRKTTQASAQTVSKSVLLLGESLFPELNLYGDDYMDQLLGGSEDHGFKTTGYSTQWSPTKLYDKTRSWTGTQAISKINEGHFSMVNHLGHSNTTYNMKLGISGIDKLKNADPYFYYTQGCFAGDFTAGSWIDKLVAADFGAYASIANSTYGLAPEDPTPTTTKTPGASQMLHRQFIHHLLMNSNAALGKIHQLSKLAFLELKSAQEIRWVSWGSTYFGDPSFQLKAQ